MIKSCRRSNCEDGLSQAGLVLLPKRNRRQIIRVVDLQQRQIGEAMDADQLRFERVLLGEQARFARNKFHVHGSHDNLNAFALQ
jgi:predicted RNase H-like nuclease (RuvC/YqgF family)